MPEHSPELHNGYDREVFTIGLMPQRYIYEKGSPVAAARTDELRDRLIACHNACRGLNPEVVPELVACLRTLYNSHQELLDRCLLHDAFLNHAQQLGAGADAIRAKELLARVKA
jgi:hypothetical protein